MLHIRGHHGEFPAVGLGEGAVLREEGGHGEDLGLRAGDQRLEHRHQGRGCAAGEEQVLRPDAGLKARVEVVGHGLSDPVVARGGGVAVDLQGVLVLHNVADGFIHQGRSRDRRIAQGIVEHVLLPHRLCLAQAVLKQLADARAHGAQFIHRIVQHVSSPSLCAFR